MGDVVLQWLVSASTCICAQSNRELRRACTSGGISGGQPNRVQPRRTAQEKTTSQFTSSCFGLVHGKGKWDKEHALSNHAKSEPSRVGRDWPVMSATLALPDYRRVARQPVTTGGRLTVPSAACTLWGRIGTFENEPNAISIVESVGPVQQQLMVSPRLIKAEPHRPD